MTDMPGYDVFAALVGERFAVTAADAEADMSLVAAQPLARAGAPGAARVPFELEFRGHVSWAQGIYRFAHPSLGQTDIFVVPTAEDTEGTTYHAVFN